MFPRFSIALVVVIAACGGSPSADEVTTTTAPTTTTTTVVATTIAPTTTAATTTTPTTTTTTVTKVFVATVTGPEEVVFDWSSDRCTGDDLPDLPARAFRDADGMVHLISTHYAAYASIGPDLDAVERECTPIFTSAFDDDPARFADYEWLAATWTDDGTTVHALVHDEYHGWERGDCPPGENFDCWYNAITQAVSTDGGRTFSHAAAPPDHLVAALPHPYAADTAAVGLFSPSNIVRGPDGAWYALAKVGAHLTGVQTVCLMRTTDIADPGAWRFWDRTGFAGVFADPYREPITRPADHSCPALALPEIGAQMVESLTWNTALERWVLIGLSADTIDGREVWGVYVSYSEDLITWTRRTLLHEMPLPWTVASSGTDLTYLYPSLLDPGSEARNFDTADADAYLYLVRNNQGQGSPDRDLVRLPVEFTITD